MGRERRDWDLDCERSAQKCLGGCAAPLTQDLEPLHFSVKHMKGLKTPMSIILVQEPSFECSSLGIAELAC